MEVKMIIRFFNYYCCTYDNSVMGITLTQFSGKNTYKDWLYYQTMFNNDKILNCCFKESY